MADKPITSSSVFNVINWSKLLMLEVLQEMEMAPLIGSDENSIIQMIDDMEQGAGDSVRYDRLIQHVGAGIWGTATLEGREQPVDFHQDTLKIDLWADGRQWNIMSSQRTVHDLARSGRKDLAVQIAETTTEFLTAYMTGTTAASYLQTGSDVHDAFTTTAGFAGNPMLAPDLGDGSGDHVMNRTNDTVWGVAGLGSAEDMSLDTITLARAKAENMSPKIRPARVNGKNMYVLYLTPNQVVSIKNDAGDNGWRDIQANAHVRGNGNRLFTGALGEYDRVILRESRFMPSFAAATPTGYSTGALHNHAALLGAQSLVIGRGNAIPKLGGATTQRESIQGLPFYFGEFTGDRGRQQFVDAQTIFGIKRVMFDGKNHGVMNIITEDAIIV